MATFWGRRNAVSLCRLEHLLLKTTCILLLKPVLRALVMLFIIVSGPRPSQQRVAAQRRASRADDPAPPPDDQAALLDRRNLLHLLAASEHFERRLRFNGGLRIALGRGILRHLCRLPRPGYVVGVRKPSHLRIPKRKLQQGVQGEETMSLLLLDLGGHN